MRRPGPHIRDGGVAFSVLSRHARNVTLCLFDGAGVEVERVPLARVSASRFEGFVAGLPEGTRYGLRADGDWDERAGHRFDVSKLLLDPYATAIDRPFAYDPRLATRGLETAHLVPKGIVTAEAKPVAPLPPGLPGLIYEVSVRSFTRLHPEIPETQRGTVKALAHPAIIDHLKRLGVGTVELMPLAAAIDERHLPQLGLTNAWGYNPVSFFAPDPRLAPGGMSEIRETVAALHAAGIRVLLDVVFNHTGESDALGPSLSLKGLDQALYFRLDGEGRLVNDTGCGNTLALDRPETMALALDALRHWAAAGFDGFRYDLATVMGRRADGFDREAPLLAALAQDPALRDLIHVAEPWDIGPGGYQVGAFAEPFAEWNDRYRDDVRRFWRGDGSVGALATRLAGSSDTFAGSGRPPSTSVNFIAAHDGMTLADCLAYSQKRNEANGEANRDGTNDNHSWNNGVEGPSYDAEILAARSRDARALLATLFFSRGMPMLTAGDEFGRTQQGNNNAYAQDNAITWLDWAGRDRELESFVGTLSLLRQRHPALTDNSWLTGAGTPADVTWHSGSGPMRASDWSGSRRLIAMELALPEADDHVLVVFNAGGAAEIELPEAWEGGAWSIALATQPAKLREGRLAVAARSVVLLADSTEPYPKGRATGASDAELRAFAWAQGVAPEWWSISGECHHVPADGLRAVLGSLGIAARTRADLREAAALKDEERRRPLPVTVVVRAGDPVLPLTLPLGGRPRQIELVLETEAGRRVLHVATADLPVIDGFEIGSERFERLGLKLPDLPVGTVTARIGYCAATLLVAPPRCHEPAALANGGKVFGLSTHLYALSDRRRCGIGDLETLARFSEAAGRLGASLVGLNPLHHLFPEDRDRASPYQPSDRRFIDPVYIDVEAAAVALDLGVPVTPVGTPSRLVDYGAVWREKEKGLRTLFAAFEAMGRARGALDSFVAAGGAALSDHALFEAIRQKFGTANRKKWGKGLSERDPAALAAYATQSAAEIRFRLFLQWLADMQLGTAAQRARAAGLSIGLYRDLAVGTALDGGEIWANPERFAHGVSIGAPPDPFSADGQVWNLPPPHPLTLVEEGLRPWSEVLDANMRHAGALRIDHILGFARLFFVPDGGTGRDGAYVKMPRDLMIAATAIASHRAECLVIGEDLGTAEAGLTPALEAAGILSSRVMWFERDGAGFADPRHHPHGAAASLSTHDLPTLAGWRSGRDIEIDRQLGRVDPVEEAVRRGARAEEIRRLGAVAGDPAVPSAAVHGFLAQSGAGVVMAQVEDLVDEIEPLNVPGTDTEWPNWRRRIAVPVEALPELPEARAVSAVLARR